MELMARGRPPLPPEERADERLNIACTSEQKKKLQDAADLADSPNFSQWALEALLKAAESVEKKTRR